MTERMYYQDAYTTEFVGRVERVEPGKEQTLVELESTYFYPTSGGQMHDRGWLSDRPVLEVREEQGRVIHVVEGDWQPVPGQEVEARIDAERRSDHRQQHTGQHVLSRVIELDLDRPTVSSRLGEGGNTLDLQHPVLDDTQMAHLEDVANALIWRGLPVHVTFLEPHEVAAAGLRKAPDREGLVRMIEVDGFDRSACGGTHVRNTAEIGCVVIQRQEKAKGGMLRLHFLCGRRAVGYRRGRDRLVSRLTQELTTGEPDLVRTVGGLRLDLKAAQRRALSLQKEALLARVPAWLDQAETLGPARLVFRELGEDAGNALAEVVQTLTRGPDVCVVLVLRGQDRHQMVVARGSAIELDCTAVLNDMLAPAGGKGGGRGDFARGSFVVGDQNLVEVMIQTLRNRLGGMD